MESCTLRSANAKLSLAALRILSASDPKKPGILFTHGTGFSKESLLPAIQHIDKSLYQLIVGFDMWNHGDSATANSEEMRRERNDHHNALYCAAQDTKAVVEQTLSQCEFKIGIGHSFGSSILYRI